MKRKSSSQGTLLHHLKINCFVSSSLYFVAKLIDSIDRDNFSLSLENLANISRTGINVM